eukprot:CAMPEP_0170081296 /NCGR_PEP_ID=MMETSP0019_2-20121128/17199_1 /TAXON_ID=98059 /ORGANISM="Dinobryon sp., Strain UTEXLB2267" /LENGTH=239 /DNA_ID=CAMNT_0010295655 /DNA_START=295 /DNA_END=1014 /DNA_ORIENTATION=-
MKIPLHAVSGRFGKNNGASAVELGSPPVETIPVLLKNGVQPQRYCYFDRRSPCPCTERCPIDDRFCGANREYFDHIYGPLNGEDRQTTETDDSTIPESNDEDNGNVKFDFSNIVLLPKKLKRNFQRTRVLTSPSSSGRIKDVNTSSRKESSSSSLPTIKYRYEHQQKQLQKLSRKERRLRRKKLFLMSTWIEDLLPDPHQGHSWMVNMVVDFFKISHRAATLIVYSICRQGNKPKFILH